MVNLPKASEYQDEGEDDSTTGAHNLFVEAITYQIVDLPEVYNYWQYNYWQP